VSSGGLPEHRHEMPRWLGGGSLNASFLFA
jgi:hypothetical protein